jgi:hypothetical protein
MQQLRMKKNFQLALWTIVFLGIPSAAVPGQTRGGGTLDVAPSLRRQLVAQVLKDDPDLQDCVKSMTPGEESTFSKEAAIEAVDLNHDGQNEYRIWGQGSCACGAQNCSVWIYERTADGFDLIFNSMGVTFNIGKTRHNGFDDLVVNTHDSAATQYRTSYMFDGRKYKEYRNDFVNLDTGQVKPGERHIHFKRGTSSAILQGTVSLGFPDTYVIGAKGGQTMSIVITGRQNAVSFTIMDANTNTIALDQHTSWTGTLPTSGNYRILVSADRGGAYGMTVSVQ